MTSSCCRSYSQKCRIAAYNLDRTLHCTDIIVRGRKSCSEKSSPGFCTTTRGTNFLCCDGSQINFESVNNGFPDCPMGEDERVQLIHCADLDLSNTHFNYIAIPLIIFLIILACCYKIRSRLGRPRDLEERADPVLPMSSAAAVNPEDALYNQVGPGWVVGSLPQPPPNPSNSLPDASHSPQVSPMAPPPYSPPLNLPNSDLQSQMLAPPPSYEEAIMMKK